MSNNNDPLYLLRLSITTSNPPTLSLGPTPTSPPPSLALATHVIFSHPSQISLPLNTPTRFVTKRDLTAFDLRSVVFAWEHRNDGIPAYVSACQSLGDGKLVKNLGFLERTDLITWLEGATDESDFIKAPIQSESTAAAQKKDINGKTAIGVSSQQSLQGAAARPRRALDPRLAEIYGRERVVANRNSILRGIKPTDFSHVRKTGEEFLKRLRAKDGNTNSTNPPTNGRSSTNPNDPRSRSNSGATTPNGIPQSISSNSHSSSSSSNNSSSTSKNRPSHPIILLSPSTSALLRMSNIKAFLESGIYSPPSTSTTSGPSMLQITRSLSSINSSTPTRFIVVDSPDQFKPDYWNRVVAVFTTGQLWQFKSYKWSTPQDLFTHTKGFYVGWSEEPVPEQVASWGNVQLIGVEKNRRFRDREVMEGLWDGIEKWMLMRGWGGGRSAAG